MSAMWLRIALTIALETTPSPSLDACLHMLAHVGQAKPLLVARDVGSLLKAYDDLANRTPALDMVYAYRRYQLRPDKGAADALLAAIPRNTIDVVLAYEVTDPQWEDSMPELENLFDEYLYAVAAVVRGTGRGVREFVMLCQYADGEISQTVHGLIEDFLLEARRRDVLAVIKELAPNARERVCGECRILRDPKLKTLH